MLGQARYVAEEKGETLACAQHAGPCRPGGAGDQAGQRFRLELGTQAQHLVSCHLLVVRVVGPVVGQGEAGQELGGGPCTSKRAGCSP